MSTSRTSLLQQKHPSARIHPFIGSTISIMQSFCSGSDDEDEDEDEDREMDTSETVAWRFCQQLMDIELPGGKLIPWPPKKEFALREKLLCPRQTDIYLKKCRVGPSTIPNAGLGVFAIRDIEPEELITLFPADAIMSLGDDEIHKFGPETSAYKLSFRDNLGNKICIVGDPARKKDSAYLGHMINDYCSILGADISSKKPEQERDEIKKNYELTSQQHANCKRKIGLGLCHVEIVATKSISAGSELFMHYGHMYWWTEKARRSRGM
jgi:SET domain